MIDQRHLRYFMEYAALCAALRVFRVLPVAVASGLGGCVARWLGPVTGRHRTACTQVEKIMCVPPVSARKIVNAMWDHIGRVIAEYPHLGTIARHRIEWAGYDHIPTRDQRGNRPLVFISGHIGNWEVMLPAYHAFSGDAVAGLLRTPNNPWVARLLSTARARAGMADQITKSRLGNRDLVRCLAEGGILGLLLDQKFNEGMPVPFFGHPAMMATSMIDLARKYDAVIMPVRCERLADARFRLTILPPMDPQLTTQNLATTLNRHFEDWIRERPDQWLWTHNRWESGRLKSLDPVDEALLG